MVGATAKCKWYFGVGAFSKSIILTVHLLSEPTTISVLNKYPNPLVTNNISPPYLRKTLTICLLSSLSKEKLSEVSFMFGL